VALLVSRNISV